MGMIFGATEMSSFMFSLNSITDYCGEKKEYFLAYYKMTSQSGCVTGFVTQA